MGRGLNLAGNSLKGAFKVVCIWAQYSKYAVDQGMELARQISFLAEQGQDPAFSQSYRSAWEALTSQLEVEAAKQLAKAHLKCARGKSQRGYHTSGCAPRRRAADA